MFYRPSRNPYSQKILDEFPDRALTDAATEQWRGKWREKLNLKADCPLDLEIGCNAGHLIVPLAALNPARFFLGMDYKFKAIHRAICRAEKNNVRNCFFLRANAVRLNKIFGSGELSGVRIFFPDPWEKRKDENNRILRSEFLGTLHPLLKVGGVLNVRTDHRRYFESFLREIGPDWKVHSTTWDKHGENPDRLRLDFPEVTLFEKIFIRQGLPVHEAIVSRN